MSGKIRELYDRSKYIIGSKLRAEADTLYVFAKKRINNARIGAFAVGENFIGKTKADGKADLFESKQPNGIFGVYCKTPESPKKVFHYRAYSLSNVATNYIAQTEDGEILLNSASSPYADALYPDYTIPRTDTTNTYQDHISRHRDWRNSLTDLIYSELHSYLINVNMKVAIMNYAPSTNNVGIGDRWIGFSVLTSVETLESSTFLNPVGVFPNNPFYYGGHVKKYNITLSATDKDGNNIEFSGYAIETVCYPSGLGDPLRGDSTTEYFNYPSLVANGHKIYPAGAFSYSYIPKNFNLFENDNLVDGEPFGFFYINGSISGLKNAFHNDADYNYYSTYYKETIPQATNNLSYTPIDLSNLKTDLFRYDKDLNNDGVISGTEKSYGSSSFWLGKGLSYNELIIIFPFEYVSLIDDEYIEVGMFPQPYDIERLVAIRIYSKFTYRYKNDGEFEFIETVTTPTLDEDGNEVVEYTEFTYESSSLLSGFNSIIIANGTGYDDVLDGRKSQQDTIKDAYIADVEAEGNITLNGLYDWCNQQV